MGAVVAIDFFLRTLMELPGEALPGTVKSEAIRELLTASACQEATIWRMRPAGGPVEMLHVLCRSVLGR